MKQIYLYNTLSGKKEEFIPLKESMVSIYNCGPTVYDHVHIGNLRTFVMYDMVRRVFEYNNYSITQVMNITDIDDKTIRKSKEQGITLTELTRHYETLFLSDIHSLNIKTPHKLLRASEHINEMIEMISILMEKNIAYPTRDGIYFSIGLFREYGKLAKINLNNEVKERILNDEYEKENPRDFALWKFFVEEDNEVLYDAPFGKGRPGWHIECSAMSTYTLGSTIDIHTGGIDLIFPHHTNEIAQSESATGKTFVKYWIHGAFMNVNDEKMAKSKDNFLKLSDLEDNGISPIAFRYWLMTSHYRTPVNFTIDAVKASQNGFVRLIEAFIRLSDTKNEHIHFHGEKRNYRDEFLGKINDDLNMPEAIALAWELIKDHSIELKEKISILLDFDKVLGLGFQGVISIKKEIPVEITVLAEARKEAREAKEWDKADALRNEIKNRGYDVIDTDDGFDLKFL